MTERIHQTQPEFYDRELSVEASEQRRAIEEKLEKLYADANSEDNPIKRVKILKRADVLEAQLMLHGANPKKVPLDTLKEHVRHPVDSDAVVNKYKSKIKNRATAIRAMCIQCMGGSLAGVRNCPSVTCTLHPFRMGKDPLRGYDIPKVEEPEIEEDENDAGEFEEGDEGSEADD